jgi:RNA polymerase subunit RPABC4/transcription elongation factor Spt4
MKLCDKCFALLEEDALFCTECGASVAEGVEGSDAIVYPDIARANLARMKGNEEEAERICLGILKRYPNNVSAHILLGDIHSDSGRLEEAVQWYDLATALAPDNAILRQKLERVREALHRQNETDATARLEVSESKSHVWTSVGIVLLILAFGGLTFWYGKMRAEAGLRESLVSTEPIDINGVVPPKSTIPKEEPAPPAEEEPPAEQSPPASQSSPGITAMTPDEQTLLQAVKRMVGNAESQVISVVWSSPIAVVNGVVGEGWSRDDVSLFMALAAKAVLDDAADVSVVEVRLFGSSGLSSSARIPRDRMAAAVGEVGTVAWARSVLGEGVTG